MDWWTDLPVDDCWELTFKGGAGYWVKYNIAKFKSGKTKIYNGIYGPVELSRVKKIAKDIEHDVRAKSSIKTLPEMLLSKGYKEGKTIFSVFQNAKSRQFSKHDADNELTIIVVIGADSYDNNQSRVHVYLDKDDPNRTYAGIPFTTEEGLKHAIELAVKKAFGNDRSRLTIHDQIYKNV